MSKVMKEEKLIDPRRGRSELDERGREDHSKSGGPLAIALNVVQRDNLGERVREMIRSERLALAAREEGYETFEEADDFNVPDDDTFDPQTPYEEVFEGSIQEDMAERYRHQQEQLKDAHPARVKEFLAAMDPQVLDDVYRELRPAPKAPATAAEPLKK